MAVLIHGLRWQNFQGQTGVLLIKYISKLKTNSSEFHYMQIIYITFAIKQSILVMVILWLNTQEDYSIISYGYLVIKP